MPSTAALRASFAALLCGLCCASSAIAEIAEGQRLTPEEVLRFQAEDTVFWPAERRSLANRSHHLLFPYVVVQPGELRALPNSSTVIDPTISFDGASIPWRRFASESRIGGLIVVHQGRIVLEHYDLGHSDDQRWAAYSVTKTVAALLVGAALQDGAIGSLDDKVSRHIRELDRSAYDDVTIAQLLSMTSGIEWEEDTASSESGIMALRGRTVIDNMKDRERVAPAGQVFHYSSGDSHLWPLIVEATTGLAAEQYLATKIWRPLGMEAEAYWSTHAGIVLGSENLQMTLRDSARLGLFLSGDGQAAGQQIVPKNWIEIARSVSVPVSDGLRYGLGLWFNADGSYQAIGIFGQTIYVDPSREVVIAINGAWPEQLWSDGYRREFALIESIRAAINQLPK